MTRAWSVILFLTGCTSPEVKDDDPPDETGDTSAVDDTGDSVAPPVPTVRITSAEGDTYASTPVTWEVSGFTWREPTGGDAVVGEGHAHVWVDGALVGEVAAGEWRAPEGVLTGGTHAVEVRLAGDDHVELGPTDAVELNVLVPTLSILSPTKGAEFTTRGFQVQVATSDFDISPDVGGANVVGEGHLILYIDDRYYATVTNPDEAWFSHVGDGDHEVLVELVNNDQSSLDPPVTAMVPVVMAKNASDVHLGDGSIGYPHDSATMKVGLFADAFQLEDDFSGEKPNADRIGHAHLYLDGVRVAEAGESFTWLRHLPPGTHRLGARLAARDHTEIGARDELEVEVVADRPDVIIRDPVDGASVASTLTLRVDTENFTLADALGQAPVEDQGHYVVLVDGVERGFGVGPEVVVEGLPPATHRLEVWLRGNDGVLLEPLVGDSVTVLVGE